jgi:hypothetical protein
VAYVPGELLKANLWMVAGAALVAVGGAAIGVEWGLREFQSFGDPTLAGRLELQAAGNRRAAVWSDASGNWSRSWKSPCPRFLLQGEFVEWAALARRAGFRNRHRVAASELSCAADGTEAGKAGGVEAVRFRPPSRTWEILRRWDRFLPMVRTERRLSPALQVASGSWRVFVMPGGYVFSE